MTYSYEYERPALTVDAVVFAVSGGDLKVLLIQRGREPFKDAWALPGGFFDMDDDSVDDAAARELQEESGLSGLTLEQFGIFSKKGRDPRGRTVSIAYYAVAPHAALQARAADDAKALGWYDLNALPPLAFDHESVILAAVERARSAGSPLQQLDARAHERVRSTRFSFDL